MPIGCRSDSARNDRSVPFTGPLFTCQVFLQHIAVWKKCTKGVMHICQPQLERNSSVDAIIRGKMFPNSQLLLRNMWCAVQVARDRELRLIENQHLLKDAPVQLFAEAL